MIDNSPINIQIYIPLSCTTVNQALPTVTSSASAFVCNCLTDVSFDLKFGWGAWTRTKKCFNQNKVCIP